MDFKNKLIEELARNRQLERNNQTMLDLIIKIQKLHKNEPEQLEKYLEITVHKVLEMQCKQDVI